MRSNDVEHDGWMPYLTLLKQNTKKFNVFLVLVRLPIIGCWDGDVEVYTLRWGRFERCVTTCEHCVLLQIVIIKVLLYFSSTSTEVSIKFVMLFFVLLSMMSVFWCF